MKTNILLPLIYLLIACVATVLTNEEIIGDSDIFGRSLRHHIVKRKGGGRGGGGRGRGSSSRGSSSHKTPKQQPKTEANAPYPKQQYSNQPTNTQHNQRPPPYNPNYPAGGQHNSASNPGYGYPGYGQTGQHGVNTGGMGTGAKAGGLGGLLGGAGGVGAAGYGASKLGHGFKPRGMMGGALGGAALGGIGGAVIGSVAGYQLGKAIGKLGHRGHYGYWDNGHYRACEPPSRVEYNPQTMENYIPRDIGYNDRCKYYDAAPSRYYGYYDGNRFYRCDLPTVQMDPLTNQTYVQYSESADHRCRYYERDPMRYRYVNGVTNEISLSFICLIVAFIAKFI